MTYSLRVLVPLLFFLSLTLSLEAARAQDSARTVSIEWDPLKKANAYELELKAADGKLTSHEVFEPRWRGPLVPGKYTFRVRALDRRKVAGEWGLEESLEVKVSSVKIVKPQPDEERIVEDEKPVGIDFAWTPAKGARAYVFAVKAEGYEKRIETSDTSVRLELPVGTVYRWSVQTQAADGKLSDERWLNFLLLSRAAGKPVFETPSTRFVRELRWKISGVSDATEIAVHRLDAEKNEWVVQRETSATTGTRLEFSKDWPGGKYRASAWAMKNGKPISQKAEVEFEVAEGDRSPAAETKDALKEYFAKDRGRFYHMNYVASSINYKSTNAAFNTRASFAAMAGTLNLGAGYLWGENRGVRAALDLGGTSIDGTNHFQKGVELQFVQRHRLSEFMDARWWAGVARFDVPDVAKPITRSEATVTVIPILAAQLGADAWYAFSGLWGMKLQLAYAHPFSGQSALGEKLQGGSKLQLGAFATYNLAAERQLHVGLSSRAEKYLFEGTGDVQPEISTSGTYLNLQYELGF